MAVVLRYCHFFSIRFQYFYKKKAKNDCGKYKFCIFAIGRRKCGHILGN